MKHLKQILSDARRHKGLALIIVLSMLALATIVILAFLSVADTEHKATITYSASQSARRFADTAVNLVISQIRSASAREPEPAPGAATYSAVPVIHATQPGAVRKYNQAGAFVAGYKLFSDANLIFRPTEAGTNARAQEKNFVTTSEPPAGWDAGENLARYVDLNEPVVKGVANAEGETAAVQTVFPIIDPRAGQDVDSADGNIPIEGFSYGPLTAISGSNLGDKVVIPGSAAADTIDDLRLPMPVQWLYILKDGTVGHLNETLQFVSEAGEPSVENPMVSRIAFWTDDETCKVNINTAAEPTFEGQPLYFHERDHRWADYPPTRSEYQRFPGHPATVALSSVLYPNPYQTNERNLETYGESASDLVRIVNVKEKIYDLMPRIQMGGSKAGTEFFDVSESAYDTGVKKAAAVDIQTALGERLYASVDELLFSQTTDNGKRVLNVANYGGGVLFDKATLERTSAFLTASSRGSEVSMFGLPKVAMWPIAEDTTRRTGFDNLIEFCSRLGPANNYI
ncbi:MAG: Verru_Chthon cassette protein A, partial [Prosthecobacter sp.]|nr:Verru_Chthon cassette protein A [Prosthecobacter sp.]